MVVYSYDQQIHGTAIQKVNKELKNYSEILSHKYQVVVLNKMDMPGAKKLVRVFRVAKTGEQIQ